ncbi:PleD family two-component system response regulator [Pseudorhodobacter sp. W20_MBD10_FR17]|uniref:response regulator n=1 Tax=Pseudorhodobacter sp. W20_MBD10_FR17 TaxID=3240266 RepID=UPI003F9D9789
MLAFGERVEVHIVDLVDDLAVFISNMARLPPLEQIHAIFSTLGIVTHCRVIHLCGVYFMKILAVDDDPIILSLLEAFFGSFKNHDVTMTSSGAEALQLIKQAGTDVFDYFMLDIQMPEMDGIELTSRIRKLPTYTDTPIIMLTAMSEKHYIDNAFAAGATDYATKPFEVRDLNARIGMAEALISARKANPFWIGNAPYIGEGAGGVTSKASLHEAFAINDVDNVIDCVAMENYVTQLSRSALFGSTVFAFTIRQIADYHQTLSSYDFHGMIEDSAEIISDCLAARQNLITYAGNGTFVCIVESGYVPDMGALVDTLNIAFSRAEVYRTGGERLHPRVSAGRSIRLVWKKGADVLNALSDAQASAEAAAAELERSRYDYFDGKYTA